MLLAYIFYALIIVTLFAAIMLVYGIGLFLGWATWSLTFVFVCALLSVMVGFCLMLASA
jgi:hypothetical protein